MQAAVALQTLASTPPMGFSTIITTAAPINTSQITVTIPSTQAVISTATISTAADQPLSKISKIETSIAPPPTVVENVLDVNVPVAGDDFETPIQFRKIFLKIYLLNYLKRDCCPG